MYKFIFKALLIIQYRTWIRSKIFTIHIFQSAWSNIYEQGIHILIIQNKNKNITLNQIWVLFYHDSGYNKLSYKLTTPALDFWFFISSCFVNSYNDFFNKFVDTISWKSGAFNIAFSIGLHRDVSSSQWRCICFLYYLQIKMCCLSFFMFVYGTLKKIDRNLIYRLFFIIFFKTSCSCEKFQRRGCSL